MTTLLLATCNQGKKREIENYLQQGLADIRLLSLADVNVNADVSETGATFAENARLKADYYSLRTGLDTLGDDSGLEVMALGGRPGVLSARYAGEGANDDARIQKLLAEMQGIIERRARFVSAVCISRNGSALATFSGQVEGEILFAKRGEGGFGYDPLFFYQPLGKTFAELTLEEKNRVSHRARALEQFKIFFLHGGLAL
ncbi:MAG: RdgB/HAM1 family non-canonical purine NTP pyrophosphatase [Candidatus Aminicenantes bacterium]|nr:RdgB/HAM1 family non-canonical purine NTP pyrophosphatase [Candidatus Aminicenantes bacterium]